MSLAGRRRSRPCKRLQARATAGSDGIGAHRETTFRPGLGMDAGVPQSASAAPKVDSVTVPTKTEATDVNPGPERHRHPRP